jgi:hypothetical protein
MLCEWVTVKGSRCKQHASIGKTLCHAHSKSLVPSAIRIGTVLRDIGQWLAGIVLFMHRIKVMEIETRECFYCKKILTKENRTKDHVTNFVKDKRIKQISNISNFTVSCCDTCNSKKGGKSFEEFHGRPIEEVLSDKIENVYYDLEAVDEICNDIDAYIVKKMNKLLEVVRWSFKDEADYKFTRHIVSDDFISVFLI